MIKQPNNQQLKQAIRSKFAWPGGYELFGITSDGHLLCYECMRENFRQILISNKHRLTDGWRVDAIDSAANLESAEWIAENSAGYGPDYCAHCDKELNP